MTLWFADASLLIAVGDPQDPHHEGAARLLTGADPIATLDLAYYEVVNVAVRSWGDRDAAQRLGATVEALSHDGGLVQVDAALAADAAALADRHSLSAYDAAYVAGAAKLGAQLVSCDIRDLVDKQLAVAPEQAVESR